MLLVEQEPGSDQYVTFIDQIGMKASNGSQHPVRANATMLLSQ